MRPFSIYFHIPYCLQKCPYCDFNTYAVSSVPEKEYVSALLAELDYRAMQPEWRGRPVKSIYFGGGTPSLFSPAGIARLTSYIFRSFATQENAEVSLEANPGAVSVESLVGYREAGINRMSFGAQSFQSELLKTLGRIHTPDQIEEAVASAISARIHNYSLDLMYGIPGQDLEMLQDDLAKALRLRPAHISAYGLTIEKGTPYFQGVRSGKLVLPNENSVIAMMTELETTLADHGYRRYEISNFARPKKQARHNLAYWNGDDYLGLGAGAHSFVKEVSPEERYVAGKRWANFALPNRYIKEAVARGSSESWTDDLSEQDLIFEFLFLGLRKIDGVSFSEFEDRFGTTLQQTYSVMLPVLLDQDLLESEGDALRLTSKGLLLADTVIGNFSEVDLHTQMPNPTQSVSEGQNSHKRPDPENLLQFPAAKDDSARAANS